MKDTIILKKYLVKWNLKETDEYGVRIPFENKKINKGFLIKNTYAIYLPLSCALSLQYMEIKALHNIL